MTTTTNPTPTLAALVLEVQAMLNARASVPNAADTAYRAIAPPLAGRALEGVGMDATEVQQLHARLSEYVASRAAEVAAMHRQDDALRRLVQHVRHPVPGIEERDYCAFIARMMVSGETVHAVRKTCAQAAYTGAYQQLAARVKNGYGLSPSQAKKLLAQFQDFDKKRDVATAFEAEKTAILFHSLDPVNHPLPDEARPAAGGAAPVPNAVDDAARRMHGYSVNLLERAAKFIAPCIQSPLLKKTMGKGAGAVTVCATWPGIVSVYDPATGELLTESEPGQPAVLRAGFTRRLH